MKQTISVVIICLCLLVTGYGQTDSHTLFQSPTLNRTHIVFVYAGDLWIVSREGGDAKRLTSGVGAELNPVFSPDGSMITFTGEYDGNIDIYVIPAIGGIPKRLTYHPGNDNAVGWSNDGKQVLFRSSRNSYAGFSRLFTIGMTGELPEELPLPTATTGSFSPDGKMLAYEPISQWQADWKRYRGGQMATIQIAKLSDSTVEKLPRGNSNDKNPIWIGDRIYFLSDRNGPVSLYVYDVKSRKVNQLIRNDKLDIKNVSAGPEALVYEQFGTIYLYDLASSKSRKVNINVAADLASVRPRYEKVGSRIMSASISPTGSRAVFEARGEIITVPADKGNPRNLTKSTGVMERLPSWSPDGKWIAYFSDESGEYALHISDQKAESEVKKIKLPEGFYFNPLWSPDSKKITFWDKFHNVYFLDIEKSSTVKFDTNLIGGPARTLLPSWSPDSNWIAYTKHLDNRLRAVFVYSLETGKTHQITDGMSDALSAVFDKSGKYLYFTASTNIGPTISSADLSGTSQQVTRSVYAVVLRNDIPSPLAPESDEEKVMEEKKSEDKPSEDKKPDEKKEGAKKAGTELVRIDFDGIGQRIISLPIPAKKYAGLTVGKANIIFILEVPSDGAASDGYILHKYDLEKRKLDRVTQGITAFEISANGEKALYRQGQNWIISAVMSIGSPAPPSTSSGPPTSFTLKTSDMEVYVDPLSEWKQMYNEAWRHQRDFFYDPGLHGVNLPAFKKMYEPYLASVAHRSDLNYLLTEAMNQLSVGHMWVFGGDRPSPNFVPGGLLGCDYKIENGRYKFSHVYNGENWNPNLRAPLTQPGVNVKAGEYLLAVNGRDLRAADNIYQFFESTAGKQVVIRVGPNSDGTGAREVTVTPVLGEFSLRHLAWTEGNRRKVSELSGGKLAYIYLPNTGGSGYESFQRYFFSQTNKEGAVVDERFNSGGALADYVVEHLNRKLLSRIAFREGVDWNTPAGAIYGPKAMLINENAGSGGDAMPWYFKKLKIGPLIGKRTWGGLVGINGTPPLMDNGGVASPSAAIYGLEGEWEVENIGVSPDIEVDLDPAAWRQGRDPQLEKAVEYLMGELKKNPPPQYKRPAFPNYHPSQSVKN